MHIGGNVWKKNHESHMDNATFSKIMRCSKNESKIVTVWKNVIVKETYQKENVSKYVIM